MSSVLVLTPTLGQSRFLAETVRSVAACGPDWRHVLVCPAAVANRLAAEWPHVTVTACERRGLYAALNHGWRHGFAADAEIWTWINDDDLLEEPGVRIAAALMQTSPGIAAMYGRVSLRDDAGKALGWLPVARRPADLLGLAASGVIPLAQPGTLLRRSATEALGGFDESYRLAGDLDYFVRSLRAGQRFDYVDREVASFRVHSGQLSKHEEEAGREKQRVVGGLPPHFARRQLARWRFRWDNRRVYLDRLRRHGFVRMRDLYRHA